MFCPNCGNQLPDGAKFCGACGTSIAAGGGAETTQPQPAQQPQPNGAYNPYAAPQQQAQQVPQAQYAPQAQQVPQTQQMPPYAGQPQPPATGGAPAKAGLSKGVIGAIIAAAVVVIAIIVVVFVVKPFDSSDGSTGGRDAGGAAAGTEASGAQSPEQAYDALYQEIIADGAFKETVTLDMNMDMSGSAVSKVSLTLFMDLDIQGYNEQDPSNMTATGSGYMEMPQVVSGRIPFSVEIKDGKMTMDMGSYGKQSESIDPADFVTDSSAYSQVWDKAQMNGNVITFDLTDAEMKELMASSAAGSTGVDSMSNYSFDNMKYTITLDDSSKKISAVAEASGTYKQSGTSGAIDMTMSFEIG